LSQRLITEKVGMCSFISYPRGTVSDLCTHTIDSAEKLGYQMGFTALFAEIVHPPHPLLLPRLTSPDPLGMDLSGLAYVLSTRYRLSGEYHKACAKIMSR
jgi:hypothetical protein